MARGISSVVTTAVVAGAIGFGAGVYLVPNEKADQFRAMVQGGLGAIYRIVHSDKANPDIPPSESSQTKAPEAQPDVPAGSQPGADANAILATRRVVVDSLSMPQLHKGFLTAVMLPPRAVRRLDKTISHHMHWTPVLLELCRRTAHQTSKVTPLRLSPQKNS